MRARAPRSLLRTPVHELEIVRRARAEWRDRLTPAGRAVVVTTLALGVLAVDTRRNQTFLLFAVAAGILVASLVTARLARARATLDLALPARATAGSDVVVKGRLRSQAGATGLLRAAFPDRFPVARLSIEPEEVVVAADGGEGASVEVSFTLRARRRGRYEITAPVLRALDPFGLVASVAARGSKTAARHVVLVGPAIFRFDERASVVARRLQTGGAALAATAGDAMELVGTREWRSGDRVRDVHWRSFARRGVPVVKEYHEELFPRVALVVDTFLPEAAGGEDQEAFEAALSVAASIADAVSHGEQVLDLLATGPELHRVQVGRGVGGLEDVLDVLACVEPTRVAAGSDAFAETAPALDAELAQVGAVFVVLLDWDAGRAAFLDRVRSSGAEVHAIVVRENETRDRLPDGADVESMPPSAVRRAVEGAR